MASSAVQFSSHLLTMQEVWFIREHPFDIRAVKVRKLAAEIDQLEDQLEARREDLKAAVDAMHTKMGD